MSVELRPPDLPDLSEAAIPPRPVGATGAAGAAPTRARVPWSLRLRELFSTYLPLLVMALLVLASWWLVKNSPRNEAPEADRAISHDPDYTMTHFALERFDASGRMKLRIEGERLRHFPAEDRIEIDQARIRAIAPDGRITLASAHQAVGNGDGSEVQLLGAAEVNSSDSAGVPLVMQGDFLHAFLVAERVQSHLPVRVHYGGTDLTAAGLLYDHAARRLDLTGPMHAVLTPRAPRPPK
jgi:lipopolysaccharide export system protein LptC